MTLNFRTELKGRTVYVLEASGTAAHALKEAGADVQTCFSAEDLRARMHRARPDLVIVDTTADPAEAPELLREVRSRLRSAPGASVLAVVPPDEQACLDAAEAGATDFLTVPLSPTDVCTRAAAHLRLRRLEVEMAQLRDERARQSSSVVHALNELLPGAVEAPPGWHIALRYLPSARRAGDFHDVFALQGGRIALCIGDVLGEGAAALTRMALARGLLRAGLQEGGEPADAFDRLNRVLFESGAGRELMTLYVAILDPAAGTLRHTTAGQGEPWLMTPERGIEMPEVGGGPPLGILASQAWETSELTLAPGDCLLIATNGLANARNSHGAAFGQERIDSLLPSLLGHSAEDALDRLLAALRKFTGEERLLDDVTLLAVERENAEARA